MNLRRANMATFPARADTLEISLRSLEPQVDEIHLVLNEYKEVPAFLSAFKKVHPILPDEDHKDVGKFLPNVGANDFVFLTDDDLLYHDRYCDWMIDMASTIGMEEHVFGLHGSIYRPGTRSRKRKLYYYSKSLGQSVYVDELGTGTVLALGKNIPPFAYMSSSQKFVDVRFAKWCAENGLARICVARPRKLIRTIRNDVPSIYGTFTKTNPPVILDEMDTYVGKFALLKQRLGPKLNLAQRLWVNA